MTTKLIWGFSEAKREDITSCVGPGWKKIVEDLIDDLISLGWDGTILQVKEKFGTLRFYIGSGNEALWARISEAENLSAVTCEVCGEPGQQYYDGWITTLCPTHAKEQGRELDDEDGRNF